MKYLSILCLFAFIGTGLFARGIPTEYGAKLGFNLAQHYGTKVDESEYRVKAGMRPGVSAGVFMNYAILYDLRLGYELLYTQKGSREKITILSMEGEELVRPAVMDVKYDLDYLELPIMLRLRTYATSKLDIEAVTGTAMSLKVHGHHELDGTVYLPDGDDFSAIPISEESSLSGVNQFDYSFVYGAAVYYRGKPDISAEFRFTLGWDYQSLPTFSLSDPVELRNQTYSLMLGVRF